LLDNAKPQRDDEGERVDTFEAYPPPKAVVADAEVEPPKIALAVKMVLVLFLAIAALAGPCVERRLNGRATLRPGHGHGRATPRQRCRRPT
jgi:hypothetical protein